jgi:Methyltransferase domain
MSRGDAFGRALVDWEAGGDDPEVFERDDGTKDLGAGHELYFASYASWPESERQALRETRGRVLDVGCGAGRVALHLQDKGFDVVGIDASELAILTARRRGLRQGWHMAADRLGRRIGSFETIVLFGNNFGMFGTPERIRMAFEQWALWTEPGAIVLAESTTPYCGGAPLVDRGYYRRNREQGLMPGQIRLRIRYRRWTSPWFDWLFVSRRDMRELLKGTGWRQSHVFGADTTAPYVALLEKH